MQQFVYLVHPPRSTFINDASPEEDALMGAHFQYLKGLLASGRLIMAGPMLTEGGFGITICVGATMRDIGPTAPARGSA